MLYRTVSRVVLFLAIFTVSKGGPRLKPYNPKSRAQSSPPAQYQQFEGGQRFKPYNPKTRAPSAPPAQHQQEGGPRFTQRYPPNRAQSAQSRRHQHDQTGFFYEHPNQRYEHPPYPYEQPNYLFDYPEYPVSRAELPQGFNSPDGCVCDCDNYPGEATVQDGCEWRMVFKAVAGNGRSVYDDWMNDGGLNSNDPDAMDITSPLPYRDGEILDKWYQLFIARVKLEVFKSSVRQTWFIFDATASAIDTWMAPDRLIAAPYENMKSAPLDVFSVSGEGANDRRFVINEISTDCSSKCGYLMVVDPAVSHDCAFEVLAAEPYFLYSVSASSCETYNSADPDIMGDRLVIHVKVCDREL